MSPRRDFDVYAPPVAKPKPEVKWTKRKVLRVWCALKNSAAKRDATLVQTLLRMIDQIKLKCSVAKWVAFVTCRRQRTREITHAVGVVFKKRSALRRWRENVVALRSRKQKIIQNFVSRNVRKLEKTTCRESLAHVRSASARFDFC